MSAGKGAGFKAFQGRGHRLVSPSKARPSAKDGDNDPLVNLMSAPQQDPLPGTARAPDEPYFETLISDSPMANMNDILQQIADMENQDYAGQLLSISKAASEIETVAEGWLLELPTHRYTQQTVGKTKDLIMKSSMFAEHLIELIKNPIEGVEKSEIANHANLARKELGAMWDHVKNEVDFALGRATQGQRRELKRVHSNTSGSSLEDAIPSKMPALSIEDDFNLVRGNAPSLLSDSGLAFQNKKHFKHLSNFNAHFFFFCI